MTFIKSSGNDSLYEVGKLDFNGDEVTFSGNADESAKVFT